MGVTEGRLEEAMSFAAVAFRFEVELDGRKPWSTTIACDRTERSQPIGFDLLFADKVGAPFFGGACRRSQQRSNNPRRRAPCRRRPEHKDSHVLLRVGRTGRCGPACESHQISKRIGLSPGAVK